MHKTTDLICQVIEEPELVRFVQNMDKPLLLRLVNKIGLEDAGDLLAIATSEQLTAIFDHLFWVHDAEPGAAEKFASDQFVRWLEIMYQVSGGNALQHVLAMDEDLLVLGLAKHLLVVDFEELSLRMENGRRSGEDDLIDKILDGIRSLEWDDYLIIASQAEGWDAVIDLLTDLDRENHAFVSRLLERLCLLTSDYIEDNGGLYEVLKAGEMLEDDVVSQRNERREQQGFVDAQTAAAFLELAGRSSMGDLMSAGEEDYITRRYFNAFQSTREDMAGKAPDERLQIKSIVQKFPEACRRLMAEAMPAQKEPALLAYSGDAEAAGNKLQGALRIMATECGAVFDERMGELHFLANVLISGLQDNGRALRPVEAAEEVMELCQKGIAHYAKKLLGRGSYG